MCISDLYAPRSFRWAVRGTCRATKRVSVVRCMSASVLDGTSCRRTANKMVPTKWSISSFFSLQHFGSAHSLCNDPKIVMTCHFHSKQEYDRAKILFEQVVQGYKNEGSIIGDSCDEYTYHNSIAMLGLIHQRVRVQPRIACQRDMSVRIFIRSLWWTLSIKYFHVSRNDCLSKAVCTLSCA